MEVAISETSLCKPESQTDKGKWFHLLLTFFINKHRDTGSTCSRSHSSSSPWTLWNLKSFSNTQALNECKSKTQNQKKVQFCKTYYDQSWKGRQKRMLKLAPYRISIFQELHCFPYFCQLELQVCAKSVTGLPDVGYYHHWQLNLYKWKWELLESYMKRNLYDERSSRQQRNPSHSKWIRGMLHKFGVKHFIYFL